MSVVIVGGHCGMSCQYKDICGEYGCKCKVYTRDETKLESAIGRPNLIILFTNLASHNMAKIAKKTAATK